MAYTEESVWAFHHLFNNVVSEHAPVKRFHIRGGHVPYMTPEWRRAIRLRNRLWKKYMRQHSESSWSDYKKQILAILLSTNSKLNKVFD
ncbi:hypothetical protein P5673_026629 [Acropora cervicornis]|uniref:Uncharacterized protein n=1 Tax=Acropora cervicornis TaxID=6130 RepID=A0AAD9Q087_ACRCE|nr:hypothetical protein P5673_026629 [Acropora cervicornis]